MNITEVMTKVDLELLKEQARTIESLIAFKDCYHFINMGIEADHLVGLLEFLDNVVIALEDL